MIDVGNVVIHRGKHQIGIRSRLVAYPCEVCVDRELTPCIVSVFPLSRVIERGTFHSTGISRFIAKPGPVPLQRPHLNRSCYVASSYSDRLGPRGSLHARIAPLPLLDSMLSVTPGARQSLSLTRTDAWLTRR